MSVPSTDLKHKYEGTGSQTEWPFTFKVFDKTQLLVKKIVGSVETELVLDVDYTVAGAGSDTGGGTVTYPIVGTALAVGEYIVIKPNFEFSQDLVLRNQNTFPPKPVEYAFDKVVMLLKQVKESLDRALLVSDAYDGDADSFITLITSTSSEILASLSGTSTTSLAIGTGSQTFVTQSGKTWSVGQRLRAVSDDATKLMEGEVTAYSGTSLTIAVDFTEGAGTHADWNISLTGARGASGSGSGDVVAANNGSDFASKPTTFANLKQLATESVTGVSRIATLEETLAGVVTDAFVAPVNLMPAISAALGFSKYYESSQITLVLGSPQQYAHGLGVVPKMTAWKLVCQTAEYGYAAGDVIYSGGSPVYDGAATGHRGTAQLAADATNIYYMFYNLIDIRRRDTNGSVISITPAKWKIVLQAWA